MTKTDAFHRAHLMRLGMLPVGYIYPKSDQAVRDLLRKRLQMVRHRVTHMLSAQKQLWRTTGNNVPKKPIKQADYTLLNMVDDKHVKMAIKSNLDLIGTLNYQVAKLEEAVEQQVELKPEFKL
jgi:hypothetical protein